MIRGTWMRVAIALVATVATVGIAAGCGGGGGGTTSTTLTATPDVNVALDKKVAAQLPSPAKSSGTLTGAADATHAPNEFIATEGHTALGMAPEPANAIAQVMG